MKVERLVCDECDKIQTAANHWHKIGVYVAPGDRGITVALYSKPTATPFAPPVDAGDDYQIHDLCGEGCLFKHIGKLLRINPATEAE